MKRQALLILILLQVVVFTNGQVKVASYPIEFHKQTLQTGRCDSYFLLEPGGQYFMLILTDDKKAEYLLYNSKMQLLSKFTPPDGLKNTVFNFDRQEYLGGVAGKGKFHFVYKVTDKKFLDRDIYYQMETIDPVTKQVSNKQLFQISKDEKLIISFGNFGQYFSITSNNDTRELKLYGLNPSGESFIKTFKVTIPETSNKKKLTDFLDDIQLVSSDEEPGLDAATEKVKLFHSPGKITITVNEKDDPTRIININTQNFSFEEKSIDHSKLTQDERGKSYVNSFLFEDNVFSLILNQKNIRIAVYEAETGKLIRTHEINNDTELNAFAELPFTETRSGTVGDYKRIDNPKKVINTLDDGSAGIMAYKYNGQIVITIGTYSMFKVNLGPEPGRVTGYTSGPVGPGSRYVGNGLYADDHVFFRPGSPSVTRFRANFYKSTQFKILLSYSGFNLVNGDAPLSINNKIKDRLGGTGMIKNQFQINEKQYIAYYNYEQKAYVIEEISMRK